MKYNYAVTGANGFIGNHLIKILKAKGYATRCIERGNSPDSFGILNIDKHTNWKEALAGIDIVFHCAGAAHIFKNDEYSQSKFKTVNEEGTIKLAEEAVRNGVKRLIFLSSIKVNGENTENGVYLNSKSPENPQDSYAKSKFNAEKKLMQISSEQGLEIVIVRPSLVYGPGVGANFLKFIKLVNTKIPLPFLSLNNKRSYIYVKNLVEFLIECSQNSNASGRTFLISDRHPLSTKELAIFIANAIGFSPAFFYMPKKFLLIITSLINKKKQFQKLSESLVLNPAEAYETLNWNPPYTTSKGIEDTVNWFIKENNTKIV